MSAFSSLLSVATHDVKLDFGGGAKIIKVDADDLFLRLNVENGFQDLFQKSLTYAALHRRPFSPPLETKDDRLNNMRNVCETFDVSGTQIRRLEDSGCKSIAHLALLNRAHLERILSASSSSSSANFIQHLEQVISILNHSPLEPLYSLKRYWHDRGLIISLDGGCPAKRKKDPCSYLHLERGARRRRSQQLSYPTNGLSPSPPPTPPSHPFAETSAGSSTTTTTTRILTLLTYNPQDPTPFRAKRRRPAEGRAVAKAAPPSLPEKDLSVPPPKIIATPATPIKISKRPFSTSSATHSRSNNSNSSPRTPSSKCGSYPASSQGYHGCLGCGKDTWVNEATGTLYKYCSPCYKSRGHRGSYHSSSIYSSSSGNSHLLGPCVFSCNSARISFL